MAGARRASGNEPESEEPKTFGELLRWHLARGTRPGGSPSLEGRPWKVREFADRLGYDERNVRNWLSGKPTDFLSEIQQALFNDESQYADWSNGLARAHRLAKGRRGESYGRQSIIDDPGLLLGHDAELALLTKGFLAAADRAAYLILGNAGYGKTTLTRKAGVHPDIMARFEDRRWFVELEEADSAGSMLAKIALAIGLARTAPWRAVRARLGDKPSLIVLDNLETPLQADEQATERLLRDLVSTPRLSIMASLRSRETIASVEWTDQIWLELLEPEDARRMFLSIARNIREDDPDLDYFLSELDGIPLAIRLVAKRASSHPNLSDLRREWERKGPSLARETSDDRPRRSSLLGCIEFSLESKWLREEGRLLFALLGRLPAGLWFEDFDILLGDASGDAAYQLRKVGLLRDNEGRVSLLAPIRDVARRRDLPEAAAQEWRKHFLSLVAKEGARLDKSGGDEAVARLAAEMPNISAALLASTQKFEERAEAIEVLHLFGLAVRRTGVSGGAALNGFLEVCADEGDIVGHVKCLLARAGWAHMRSSHDASADYERARTLLDESVDPRLRADCLWGLADIARMLDENDRARELFDTASALYRAAAWPTGEASCLKGLADIARVQAEPEKARELYEAARDRFARERNQTGEAACLSGLAEMSLKRSDPSIPRALYERARELFSGAGALMGEADCLAGLAAVARLQSEAEESRKRYEAARDLYRRAGGLMGEAQCLCGLAEIESMQGRLAKARELYEAARTLYQRDGRPTGEANCLLGLAEIAWREDDYERSRDLYEIARPHFERARWREAEGDCLLGLAAVARVQGESEKASEFYSLALQRYRPSGHLTGEGYCLWGLAEIARLQDEFAKASELYLAAAEMHRCAGWLVGEADSLWGLAATARMRDEDAEARRLYEAALELFKRANGLAGQADCLAGLAAIARMQIEDERDRGLATARELLENARDLYRLAGRPAGVANCLWSLADIERMQDGYAKALELYEDALNLYKLAGWRIGEADCLWGLADISRLQCNHEISLDLYSEAQQIYQSAGLGLCRRTHRMTREADCLWGLADIARILFDHKNGRSLYEEAQQLYRSGGWLAGEADCLWGLADIERLQPEHDKALELYEAARALFQRARWLRGEADCLRGLADIARMSASLEKARGHFKAAQALYRRAGWLTEEAECLAALAGMEEELGSRRDDVAEHASDESGLRRSFAPGRIWPKRGKLIASHG